MIRSLVLSARAEEDELLSRAAKDAPIASAVWCASAKPVATSTPQERHAERARRIASMSAGSHGFASDALSSFGRAASHVRPAVRSVRAQVDALGTQLGLVAGSETPAAEPRVESGALPEGIPDEARYMPYTRQIPRMMRIYSRYVAYASDVGEALRPVRSSGFVNGCYGVAISYVCADIGYSCWKENERNPGDWHKIGRTFAHATLFQGVASLLLPSLIIHSAVHYSHKPLLKLGRIPGRWGPVLIGLGLIPFLPAVCDHPVEWALDEGFKTYWPVDDHRAPLTISGGEGSHGHGHGSGEKEE
jgi:fission process protein 1